MADKRDYYEVLGVTKAANADEIKKAYRKLAKQFHPDVNPGDKVSEQNFKEASEAYEVLSDSDKKGKYDQFGHAAFDPNSGYGGGASSGGAGFGFDFEDIFSSFFGGGGRSGRGPQKGADVKVVLDITFEEAAFGVEREIAINKHINCDKCEATGSTSKSSSTCRVCGGAGQVQVKQNTPFGQFMNVKTCDACHGEGKIIKDPCPECSGYGKVRRNVKILVKIPQGIDQGQTISIRSQGEAGQKGAPSGDLLVTIRIKPHAIYKRDNFNVFCEIPLSFVQATLGDEIQVPTLDGTVSYLVPDGTQTGTVFRLKNKGVPHLRGAGRGDQYVTVKIQVPQRLTEHQKELLKDFDSSITGVPKEDKKGFFKKGK